MVGKLQKCCLILPLLMTLCASSRAGLVRPQGNQPDPVLLAHNLQSQLENWNSAVRYSTYTHLAFTCAFGLGMTENINDLSMVQRGSFVLLCSLCSAPFVIPSLAYLLNYAYTKYPDLIGAIHDDDDGDEDYFGNIDIIAGLLA